jgi:hypothetical protein
MTPGGLVYHVLNRSVAGLPWFRKRADYEAFERIRTCVARSRPYRRACEEMGLAPSENPENVGKSVVAKVPVPIFSPPRSEECRTARPKIWDGGTRCAAKGGRRSRRRIRKTSYVPRFDPSAGQIAVACCAFWVPKVARWEHLQANAPQPTIGKLIDEAMVAIEKDNPVLKGVLPKDYARPSLDKHRLGELINLIGTIGLGDAESRSKDILGRVYEYFLGRFANAEGKGGGEFYTPQCVVRVLVEMIEPYKGRIYDPCCGSGGMFVQSEKFVLAHGGRVGDLSIYGQESNSTTWRLCKMNLAIRGIEGNIGPHQADTFHNDLHKDLKANFILANPPFNVSDWGGDRLREDARWKYGTPPVGNANFAWVQHMVHHLAPSGLAGFVLANGSMSSNQSGEGEIRRKLIEADLVDCMIALPGQLFYTTQIPACLWFLAVARRHDCSARVSRPGRNARPQVSGQEGRPAVGQRDSVGDRPQRLPGHRRLLQERDAGRHSPARPHPHARPVRRRGRGRRRRRAVRGQDGPPDRRTPRPDQSVRQSRQTHLGQPGGHRLWRVNGRLSNSATCS